MPKKKKMKFNYDTYMYKTYWPENRFSAEKMDLGGGVKITIDYRPKSQKNAQYSRRVLSSTTRIPPYESRFPAQNAPIISSLISIFLADKPV